MKLSWLNTSEAHTNKQAYNIWMSNMKWCKAQCKGERELEKVDQTQTHRYVSRFEHTALRPRLHTEGFPLILHTGPPTQGTSTEDLGKYNREYTAPLSNKIQPLHLKARHKANTISTLQMRVGTKQKQLSPHTWGIRHLANKPTITSTLRGILIQPPQSPLTRGISTQSPLTREISQRKEGLQHLVISTTTNQFSH